MKIRWPKWGQRREDNKGRKYWQGFFEGVGLVLGNFVMNTAIKLSLVVVAIGFLIIILRWAHLPPEVPLFYSLPWGENQLADQVYLLILPVVSLVVVGVNLLVSAVLVRVDEMAGIILNCASLGVAILAVFTLFRIVALVS